MNSGGYQEAIEELRRLAGEVETAVVLEQLRPIFYRVDEIARAHNTEEVQSIVAGIRRRIAERGMFLKQQETAAHPPEHPPDMPPVAPEPLLPPVEADSLELPPPPKPSTSEYATPEQVAIPGMYQAVTDVPPQPPVGPPPWWRRPYVLAGGGLLVVLLALAVVWSVRRPEPSALIPIQFQTVPPGASIRIDHTLRGVSDCQVELMPGTYKLEMVLDGHQPYVSDLTVDLNSPRLVSMTLQPLPQAVRIYTDLRSGSVFLNDERAGDLQEGQLILESVPLGTHSVKVSGRGSEASFSFELAAGKAPRLTGPITATNVLAVLVSNAGGTATAHSSSFPMKLAFDGRQVGDIGPEGLPLDNVTPGDHQLLFGEGDSGRSVFVTFGVSPVLTAFLKLDLNIGTLLVATNEDDVAVFLNGREQKKRTSNRELRIPLLDVGRYEVSVFKEGYDKPQPQSATIRKGGETRLEFLLRSIPKMAALRIQGALAGATVLLDRQTLGVVQADGSFSASGIAPGEHRLELRMDKHRPVVVRKSFVAGETLEVSGSEVTLARLPGSVRLLLSPADSAVTIRNTAERQARPVTETSLSLVEGSYELAVSAPGYSPKTASIHVFSGEAIELDLRLSKEAPTIIKLGMDGWEQPGAWVKEGAWLARRGGRFVMFRPLPGPGAFLLTAAVLRGQSLQWVVNFTDEKNHDLFELDKNYFYKKQVRQGKTTQLARTRHGLNNPSHFTFNVDIAEHSLVHRIYRNGTWVVLDAAYVANADLTAGRFGLLIPDNTQVGLSDFSFTSK